MCTMSNGHENQWTGLRFCTSYTKGDVKYLLLKACMALLTLRHNDPAATQCFLRASKRFMRSSSSLAGAAGGPDIPGADGSPAKAQALQKLSRDSRWICNSGISATPSMQAEAWQSNANVQLIEVNREASRLLRLLATKEQPTTDALLHQEKVKTCVSPSVSVSDSSDN